MIDVNKLRGAIRSKGMTQGQLAKEMGIAEQTLSRKMNKGVLSSTEMDLMIKILEIEDPSAIFFASIVAQ